MGNRYTAKIPDVDLQKSRYYFYITKINKKKSKKKANNFEKSDMERRT